MTTIDTVDTDKLYKLLQSNKDASRVGSWRELGRNLGIPSSTFTRLKHGRAVSAGRLVQLAEFLKIHPREVMRGERKAR